jgi:hypothetical protein
LATGDAVFVREKQDAGAKQECATEHSAERLPLRFGLYSLHQRFIEHRRLRKRHGHDESARKDEPFGKVKGAIMGVFVKFLVSLVAHLLWQRVGGRGGIPPVRLPRSNKPVIIPAVSTWQMMIAMWIMKKFWAQYGGHVKTRLSDTSHPIPRRIGSWLPDIATTGHATANTTATVPAPPVTSPSTLAHSTPTTSAAVSSTPQAPSALAAANAPATTRAMHYGTQRLDDDADLNAHPSGHGHDHQPGSTQPAS